MVQGDLTALACDGVLLPCDGERNVSSWWFPLFGSESTARRGFGPLAAEPQLKTGTRSPRHFVLADTVTPASIGEMVAAVEGGLGELATKIGGESFRGKPLLALPLPGTGMGGRSRKRGEVIARLVPVLEKMAQGVNVDIALLVRDRQDLVAVQNSSTSVRWATFGCELARVADDLGARTAAGEVSLFIGAGVSQALGLPGWADLLRGLGKEVDRSYDLPHDSTGDPAVLESEAARIHARLGPDFAKEIKRLLSVDHYALSHGLLATLGVRQMVTTNFDKAMELALAGSSANSGEAVRVLTKQAAVGGSPWLLKLHGDIGRPETIVLTHEQYEEHAKVGKPLYGLVQGLLLTSHLLFVGFSLTDRAFIRLANEVHNVMKAAEGVGDQRGVGTVLALRGGDLQWATRESIQLREFGVSQSRETATAARDLEVFLDRLLWATVTKAHDAHAYLLDERYSEAVHPGDRPLREALLQVGGTLRATPRTEAQQAVARLLAGLGWRDEVPSSSLTGLGAMRHS